ncbi:MAG: hypothetical protein RLZZ591_131 [Pseudomonadota bacterium]|jgi:putative thiamine transport system permease protein
MAGAQGRSERWVRALCAALALVAVPLPMAGASLWALQAGLNLSGWRALLADPQTWHALALSLVSGLGATALTVTLTAWLLAHSHARPLWARMASSLAPLLAVPHAAFAIGFVFLVAPSGWLLRALSPWLTSYTFPPPWSTTQDPWALGLAAVLVVKEIPFLLWAAATQLHRPDVASTWTRQWLVARSMGYAPSTAWWRVVWPQLWPRLTLPALAVLAYNLTVVDVALVIGPTSPPTLGVLAWQWLMDADPVRYVQGVAAAWLLAATLAVSAWVGWYVSAHRFFARNRTAGVRGHKASGPSRHLQPAAWAWITLLLMYGSVMLALVLGSVSGVWAFPNLLPETLSWQAWQSVLMSSQTLSTTVALGLASSLVAWAWAILWLECLPASWDHRLSPLISLPLVLPAVLWVVGLHALALRWQLDASLAGVYLAHTLMVAPYVLMTLRPAYAGFDERYRHVSASMGHGYLVFLWWIKWPLLRSSLAASLAVGFAVSVAQYLPTLFVGAGRVNTITTEAVTLAAGAQRSLTSAYAWLQWLLPVLGFALAQRAGRPRRCKAP